MSDLLKKLDEDQNAEAWQAEAEGDLIAGTVIRINNRTTDFGTYPVITLADITDCIVAGKPVEVAGARAYHAMGTVAQNWVEEKNPRVGWKMAVRFDGTRTGQSGNDYKAWSLAGESPVEAITSGAVPRTAEERREDRATDPAPFD